MNYTWLLTVTHNQRSSLISSTKKVLSLRANLTKPRVFVGLGIFWVCFVLFFFLFVVEYFFVEFKPVDSCDLWKNINGWVYESVGVKRVQQRPKAQAASQSQEACSGQETPVRRWSAALLRSPSTLEHHLHYWLHGTQSSWLTAD